MAGESRPPHEESDPVIDEIREIRHRISAHFDHDPARLVAHYMELQKQYEDRLIKSEKDTERAEGFQDSPGTD
jgi:hypothetical protein